MGAPHPGDSRTPWCSLSLGLAHGPPALEHPQPIHLPTAPLPSHPLLTAWIIQEQDVVQAEIAMALAGNHRLEEDLRHRTEGSRLARGVP